MSSNKTDWEKYLEDSQAKNLELYWNNVDTVQFFNLDYWGFMIAIGAIFIHLLFANLLIEGITPLKKALIPSPVLGGFLLLAFLAIYEAIGNKELFNKVILEMFTYHFLGIGIVASSMKRQTKEDKATQKKLRIGIFNCSLVTIGGYLIQALIGLISSVSLYFIMKTWPAAGMLIPMGFGQGPGQAMNWGQIYESTEFNDEIGKFENGKSFGLSVSALGFIVASIGGVIYLNVEKSKGKIKFTSKAVEVTEVNTLETYETKNDIPSSGNIDKLSVQLGFVIIPYIVGFGIIYGIHKLCVEFGFNKNGEKNFLFGTVDSLIWGFNFIFGLGVGVGFKALIGLFEKKEWIKKNYINNYQLDRISGFSYDILVVSAIASIRLDAIANKNFIAPLLIICALAGVGTYFYIKLICEHLYSEDGYYEESFLCMFGMLTGTVSTGVILLRQIDPKFQTPAQNNMIFQSLWSIALGAPVLLLMTTAAENWKGLIISSSVFAAYFVIINLVIYRDKICQKKNNNDNDKDNNHVNSPINNPANTPANIQMNEL